MERIVKLHLSEADYCTFANMYVFDKVPPIAELRKDYWQEIQTMSRYGKFSCSEQPLDSHIAEDGVTWIRTVNRQDGPIRSIVASCCENNEATVNLNSFIGMFIVFPDWDTRDMTIMVDGVTKLKIHGDAKVCSRYISAFCYDVQNNKLYKTSGCESDYRMV